MKITLLLSLDKDFIFLVCALLFVSIAILLYVSVQKKYKNNETMRSKEKTVTIIPLGKEKDETRETINTQEESPEESVIEKENDGGSTEEDPTFSAIKYSYSYFAHLTLASEENQERYNELKNLILSYKDVKTSITWKEERFIYNGKTIIKFRINGNVLRLYLGLTKKDWGTLKGKFQDLSTMKEHELTPALLRVSGNTGLKWAIHAISLVMSLNKLDRKENQRTDNFVPVRKDFDTLYRADYIRKIK